MEFGAKVIARLRRRYMKSIGTMLEHGNVGELLVATILSPQCTDKQVNAVTKSLFKRYASFDDYAKADATSLQLALKGVNYYKTKARNLKRAAKMIVDEYGGRVPNDMEKLMRLPGVGRKVANVVMANGFRNAVGIAVDTHCITVSRRLKLTRHKNPHKIEADLMRKIPKKDWVVTSNLFIALGRDVCRANKKICEKCVLKDICPSSTQK